jgi:F-type H+-transporting ATPase subunit gamma
MPGSQRDVRNRISSVKNIQKITRAMEMVAAARLRRAEQRIEALRPYASAIRRMTRPAAEAAGDLPRLPILQEHAEINNVGLLLIAGDRGLAGAFNSNIVRGGVAAGREQQAEGRQVTYYTSGRRPTSSLTFRGLEPEASFVGFSDRPSYADARSIAERVMEEGSEDESDSESEDGSRDGAAREGPGPLVEYEPDPEEILARLVPDYVEISIYRALLESTASEHGARMTAMRNASDNAGNLIDDLTLEMNRARQAEITQEIMEVVAGAEGLG